MISSVHGEVLDIALDHAVIEVGGVGFAVQATPTTLATLRRGERARLFTTLVVREDSLTLYGFADVQSRELFTLLQTVSGVGPRLALATLAVLDPDKLCAALSEGNTAVLTQVPGIGRKGAERLSLELRDKVVAITADSVTPTTKTTSTGTEVIEALTGLGFSGKQAEQAVEHVLADGADASTPALLRSALAVLGRR